MSKINNSQYCQIFRLVEIAKHWLKIIITIDPFDFFIDHLNVRLVKNRVCKYIYIQIFYSSRLVSLFFPPHSDVPITCNVPSLSKLVL